MGSLKEPDGIGGPENTGVTVTQPVPFPGGPGEGSGEGPEAASHTSLFYHFLNPVVSHAVTGASQWGSGVNPSAEAKGVGWGSGTLASSKGRGSFPFFYHIPVLPRLLDYLTMQWPQNPQAS